MVEKTDRDTDESISTKPKFNKVLIALFGFLGLFCVAMITTFVMLIKMQNAPQEPSAQDGGASESDRVVVKPHVDEKAIEAAKAEVTSEK